MKNTMKRIGVIFAVVIMTVSLFSIISAAVSYPGHEDHYITFHGAVEATGCTDGKTGRAYCEACSIWIGESVIIPAPHYPSEWEIVGAVADCTYGYLMEKKCTQCDAVIDKKTVNEHDYKIYGIVQNYCDEVGTVTKICKVCARISYETLPAQLHSWGNDPDGDWEIIGEKTCTSDGLLRRYCKN